MKVPLPLRGSIAVQLLQRIGSLVLVMLTYYLIWYVAFGWLWQELISYVIPANLTSAQLFWVEAYGVHIWAALLALLAIRLLGGRHWLTWGGLNFQHADRSLLSLLHFCLLYGAAALNKTNKSKRLSSGARAAKIQCFGMSKP